MCGIAGIFSRNLAPEKATLERMLGEIPHRGPDGRGIYTGSRAALGYCRLAFTDIAGGTQPIRDESGERMMIANAEIYNAPELRSALQSKGHVFSTGSDVEVILHLFEEHGAACLAKLEGMFAFAIWCERSGELFLARDRFGIKPLYYADSGEAFAFASELKSLLALDKTRKEIDVNALASYFATLAVSEPYSIFKGIAKLPPAHYMIAGQGGMKIKRYWMPRAAARENGVAASELRDALTGSVRSTLISEAPLGVLLSGGLDSSIVAALAARERPGIPTFSLRMEEAGYDEGAYSREAAHTFGTEHYEVTATVASITEALEDIGGEIDEPFADASFLPSYLIFREASRSVKGLLTGEGADELFAGSPWHAPGVANGAIVPASRRIFSYEQIESFWPGSPGAAWESCGYIAGLADCDTGNAIARAIDLDLALYLPSDLLVKADRMSMLCSIEARVPYLNASVADAALAIPAAGKISDELRKIPLKESFRDLIPESIVARPKQGFSIPLDLWLWQDTPLRDLVYGALFDRNAKCRQLFDYGPLESMRSDHERLIALHGYRLFTLYMLERWLRSWT